MDINITLCGQMLTFGVLILVIYFRILPTLKNSLAARQKRIADGLQAGEQGRQCLQRAAKEASEQLQAVQQQGQELLRQAQADAAQLLVIAQEEGQRLQAKYLADSQTQIEQQWQAARAALLNQESERMVSVLERVLSGGAAHSKNDHDNNLKAYQTTQSATTDNVAADIDTNTAIAAADDNATNPELSRSQLLSLVNHALFQQTLEQL